jgi:fibronectin type 3 domain-containing protein
MKFAIMPKLFATLFFVLLAMLAVGRSGAQDSDLTSKYQWKPVQIGAGGWMRGLAVAPTGTAAYARGDVDQVYRWSSSAEQWYPTKVFNALPSAYTGAPVNAGGGAIAIDPSNSNHVLVVFTLSGSADLNNLWGLNVFYSTDGANTYKAANLSLSGSLSQETTGERLVIDPNNGNVAYLGPPGAGTGNGNPDGLQRSLDGGATWTQVTGGGLPVSTASVRYEFQLPRIDGGSGTGTIGGQTASKIIYVTYIKHDETNSDAVVGGGILTSADGGNNWTDITGKVLNSGASTAGFATVDNSGNLWIADSGNNNLYKWTRAGTTWVTTTAPHGGGGGIAVDPRNAQRIFALGNASLARSLNGGASWTDLGAMQFASNQTIEWLSPSSFRPQGHYVSVSGLYFDAAGTLWAAGANDGIMTYTPSDLDTSTTWTSNSEGIEEAVAEPSVIPPGGKPVLTVEDESLFTISDPDTYTALHYPIDTWNSNNGLASATDSSYAPNQPKYVVALTNNIVAGNPLVQTSEYSGYSSDGGTTWQLFPSIANGTHPCILYGGSIAVSARAAGHENDPAGADNLVWIPSNFNDWAVFGHGPAPFYSKDGGATWTQTSSFDNAPGATKRSECSSNTSYTYTDAQWGPWVFALSQHLLVADPVTPGTFYVHMTAGGFWKSTDGGVTWTQRAGTNAPNKPHHGTMAAVPGVSGDMWLVDGHEGAVTHGLFHTLDGGNTFTRSPVFDYAWTLALGKPAPGQTYPAIYVDGLYHGDTNWGIFQSIDGGNTFNRISNYPYGIVDIPNTMTASWDVFGTVYIGFEGNTFYYGIHNDTTDPVTAPVLSAVGAVDQVNLSWVPGAGGTPTGFSIYRGTASGNESSSPIATVDGNTYSYTDVADGVNVIDGTPYFYSVQATSISQGAATSNEVSATPKIPPLASPANLSAAPGDGMVTLTWSAVSGAASYNIYRGTTSGGESGVPLATGVATTTYQDAAVTNGTTYYYTVTAVGTTGESAYSGEVQTTPNSAANSSAIAQIGYATTPPALDGTVSAIWSNSATYPLFNVSVGTIPSGQPDAAKWQALWDNNNLYVKVNVVKNAVATGSDSLEIFVDGNDAKKSSYTSLDSQWIVTYGQTGCTIGAYIGGGQEDGWTFTTPAGSACSQTATGNGYMLVAQIPWSGNPGLSEGAKSLIGFDVSVDNYDIPGTTNRTDQLSWFDNQNNNWDNPSYFGTAELEPGAALPVDMLLVGGPYAIVNRNSGEDINDYTWGAAGGALYQYTVASPLSGTGKNSQFYAATNPDGYYTFAESYTFGNQIGVANSATPGSNIDVEASDTTGGQEWMAVPTDPGFFKLVNKLSGLALDVQGSAISLGANLIQNTDTGSFSQQWQFIPLTQYPSPVLTPAPGTYTTQQTVTLASPSGGSINYTIDGTTPSATTGLAYSAPIIVSSSTTVKAIAYGSGGSASQVTSNLYSFVLGAPTGLNATIKAAKEIDLSWTAPVGTVVSYNVYRSTTSGGEGFVPLASGVLGATYADTAAQPGVQYYYTVAAVSTSGTGVQSAEATVALTQAATPTFTPTPGNFVGTQTVNISTTSTGAGIIYTTDGSTPSMTNGTTYSGPITVVSSTTVKAIAYGAGHTLSTVGTGAYGITLLAPTGLTSSVNPTGTEIDLSWTASVGAGAGTTYNIYRGNASGGEGTTPIKTGVTGTTFADTTISLNTLYAYTVAAVNAAGVGLQSNESAVDAVQLAAPQFSVATGTYSSAQTVSLSAAAGTTIRYTLDGSTPTASTGTVYSTAIVISTTTTAKAIGYATGFVSSPVATATYIISAPQVPISLSAQAVSGTEIDLNWVTPVGVTVPSYNVYRATTAGGESATPVATATTGTTYADKTVVSGSTYFYIVTALNGAVANSNEASATATAPALSLGAGTGNTSATVTAGDTAVFNLTLSSVNYTGTVSYSCTGAPAGGTCKVVPSTVNMTPSTTSAQVVVTVQTAATNAMMEKNSLLLGMIPWMGCILCAPLWFKRKRLGGIAVLFLAAALLVAAIGCAGTSSKAAPATSTLTVTATGTGGVAPSSTMLTVTIH